MYSDSDTESDSGASEVARTGEFSSSLPNFSSTPPEKRWCGSDVLNAVEELGALDIGDSESVSYQNATPVLQYSLTLQETVLHELISSASTTICSFLDSVNSCEQDEFGLKDILALAVMLCEYRLLMYAQTW